MAEQGEGRNGQLSTDDAAQTHTIDRRTILQTTGTGLAGLVGVSETATAQDTSGGDLIWEFKTDSWVGSSPTIVDETVLIPADGSLYAIDAESGTKQWTFEPSSLSGQSPSVSGNTVFVGGGDGLYAVNLESGNKEWTSTETADLSSSPTVVDGTVFFGSYDNNLYAVDAESGNEEWAFETGDSVWASPTVVDGTVFVGSYDNNLYAVNADSGDEEWVFEAGGGISSSPTVFDGTVVVGSFDKNIYAVDAESGTEQWSLFTANHVSSSPTVIDGTVFIGAGRNLLAIDLESGNSKWNFVADPGSSSPTVADGTVFIGKAHPTDGGALYAVDRKSGEKEWVFETSDIIKSSPTVVNGTVFVGSHDGTVYALDAGVSGSSEGSRVNLGTLGHHHVFAGNGPTPPGESSGSELDASFVVSPEEPNINQSVTFDASGAEATEGDITEYRWDFTGDGETDKTGEVIEHTFDEQGQYNVTLTVVDDNSAKDDTAKTIEVEGDGFYGIVSDIDQSPSANATVRLFDASEDADTIIAQTTTASDNTGTYAFTDIENKELPDRVLVVAENDEWFATVEIDAFESQLPLEYDFTLDHEVLFGPKIASDGTDDISVCTCWRRVIDRQHQTIYLEAVNLARAPPNYEITVDQAALTSGNFALTVLHEDVWINFGSQSEVEETVPGRAQIVNLATRSKNTELASWHPVRTDLPLYQLGTDVGAAFEKYSTTDAEVAETINEGVGIIAGVLPGISSMLTWLDTIKWAFGDQLTTEATLGAGVPQFIDPTSPETTQATRDPNEHTTAQLAWQRDNPETGASEGAAVMAVPIEFQYDGSRSTIITAEAEWLHPDAHVSFTETFELGPVGGPDSNKSSRTQEGDH